MQIRVLITSRHSGFKEESFHEFKLAVLLPLNRQMQLEMASKRLNPAVLRTFEATLGANPLWGDMARSPLLLSLLIHHFNECDGKVDQLSRVSL